MLISSAARRRAMWVPAMRCLGVALALVLAALGAGRGNWQALWFVAAAGAIAVAAGATWRHAVRHGEEVTVWAPLRRPRTVTVTRLAIRLQRSGYGDATTLTVGPGTDDVIVPIAVFTPSSRGQIVGTASRLAAALDLSFDEREWAPWLAGQTLRGPRHKRRRTSPSRASS